MVATVLTTAGEEWIIDTIAAAAVQQHRARAQ